MNSKKNTVQVCLTNKCNYHCVYCFSPVYLADQADLDVAIWIKIIKRIIDISKKCEITRINFVGGEPFLSPALFDVIDLCFRNGIKCALTTNGSLLTEEIAAKLQGKIEHIGLSIDSINQKTNIMIGRCDCGNCLTYSKVVSISRFLFKHNIPLKINRVLSTFNCCENPSFLDSIVFGRLKLMEVYINNGINDNAVSYRLSRDEFQKAYSLYMDYSPEVETAQTMTDAYYMINSNGDIVMSRNGKIINYGNILSMQTDNLIALWL